VKQPAYLSQPNIVRLPNLLREIREGEIRIPRFQRPFVWTTEQRLLLMRSIFEGMPIGSILIWRTKEHNLATYDKLGPLTLAKSEENAPEEVRQYVLDGHQRLTTLYSALGWGLTTDESPAEAPGEDEDALEGWEIFFNLRDRTFEVQTHSGPPPLHWLPLQILLDPFRLYAFQKKLLDAGMERTWVNRAEALASTFKDYSIPVVPIVTEDLDLATQSFQRVNSGGTSMTEVHMVSALTWSPEFDLNERMKEALGELGEVGWQGLEEKMILNTCKAALDLDIYYSDVLEIRDAIKERPQVLQEATDSLKLAADFLKRKCRVHGPAVLPYSFQIVLLADALQRGKETLNESRESSLGKWFWLTTYTEYFAGISAVRLAKALDHIRLVLETGASPEPPGMSREVRPLRRFDFRAARSRAIALRLATLKSRNGRPDDPFQLLADYGPDAMPMLLSSREVGLRRSEGPENRFVSHPSQANHIRRAIGHPSLFPNPDLLESHAIGSEAAEALWAGDLAKFLTLRRKRLMEIEGEHLRQLGLRYHPSG
jgi:hypothetical protein